MANKTKLGTLAILMLLAMGIELGHSPPAHAQNQDTLFIGDDGDNSVKQFGASDGQPLGTFVKSVAGLHGPMGLIVPLANQLLVADQNTGTSTNSDVLLYGPSGLISRVISQSDPNAPGAARGMIFTSTGLWVAEFGGPGSQRNKLPLPGRLLHYSAFGTFIAAFTPPADTSLGACTPPSPALPTSGEFHPRGIVQGPDGLLYVSNFPCPTTLVGGQVLRFKADGTFDKVFVSSVHDLNRPEGLVFSPDGNLYVTSFRDKDDPATSNDKILIFQGPGGLTPGAFLDQIDLDPVNTAGSARTYAQALLFGPGGKLYVPITGNAPDTTGSVRRYDVSTKAFDVFVPPGSLQEAFYLTFGMTNTATLNYPGP